MKFNLRKSLSLSVVWPAAIINTIQCRNGYAFNRNTKNQHDQRSNKINTIRFGRLPCQ